MDFPADGGDDAVDRRRDGQTTPLEPQPGIQGEGAGSGLFSTCLHWPMAA